MPRTATSPLARLLALALVVALFWLAQQAGRAGIAGIYGASASGYQQEMQRLDSDSGQWAGVLAQGEHDSALARQMAPHAPGYALQAADFALAQQRYEAAADLLRAALAGAPVRADLWSRLARSRYALAGASAETLHALDRALFFGPREEDSLLVNAAITLDSGEALDAQRRLRGWNGIVEAVGMPGMSARQVRQLVKDAGMERQLQGLLRQKAQQRGRGLRVAD